MRILAISAHPDDETLGCGGTLHRHAADGDEIAWFVATAAHEPRWSAATIQLKYAEVDRVARSYGVSDVVRAGLPAAGLTPSHVPAIMASIEELAGRWRPQVVYLVNDGDVHTDHRVVHDAATRVLKPFKLGALGVDRVLVYETLSSTEQAPRGPRFRPQVYVDISRFIDAKLATMDLFASESQSQHMPRTPSAIRALARLRGATIATEYAEAFELLHERR